jgi:hypothetical protein
MVEVNGYEPSNAPPKARVPLTMEMLLADPLYKYVISHYEKYKTTDYEGKGFTANDPLSPGTIFPDERVRIALLASVERKKPVYVDFNGVTLMVDGEKETVTVITEFSDPDDVKRAEEYRTMFAKAIGFYSEPQLEVPEMPEPDANKPLTRKAEWLSYQRDLNPNFLTNPVAAEKPKSPAKATTFLRKLTSIFRGVLK